MNLDARKHEAMPSDEGSVQEAMNEHGIRMHDRLELVLNLEETYSMVTKVEYIPFFKQMAQLVQSKSFSPMAIQRLQQMEQEFGISASMLNRADKTPTELAHWAVEHMQEIGRLPTIVELDKYTYPEVNINDDSMNREPDFDDQHNRKLTKEEVVATPARPFRPEDFLSHVAVLTRGNPNADVMSLASQMAAHANQKRESESPSVPALAPSPLTAFSSATPLPTVKAPPTEAELAEAERHRKEKAAEQARVAAEREQEAQARKAIKDQIELDRQVRLKEAEERKRSQREATQLSQLSSISAETTPRGGGGGGGSALPSPSSSSAPTDEKPLAPAKIAGIDENEWTVTQTPNENGGTTLSMVRKPAKEPTNATTPSPPQGRHQSSADASISAATSHDSGSDLSTHSQPRRQAASKPTESQPIYMGGFTGHSMSMPTPSIPSNKSRRPPMSMAKIAEAHAGLQGERKRAENAIMAIEMLLKTPVPRPGLQENLTAWHGRLREVDYALSLTESALAGQSDDAEEALYQAYGEADETPESQGFTLRTNVMLEQDEALEGIPLTLSETEETTWQVRVRLLDGKVITIKLNPSHTVGDLLRHVATFVPLTSRHRLEIQGKKAELELDWTAEKAELRSTTLVVTLK